MDDIKLKQFTKEWWSLNFQLGGISSWDKVRMKAIESELKLGYGIEKPVKWLWNEGRKLVEGGSL